MTAPTLHLRHLASQRLGDLPVLDVVQRASGTAVFFSKGVTPEAARAAVGTAPRFETRIDTAPILICDTPPPDTYVALREHDILAGLNVIIATRNGEPVATVVEWLRYHHRVCGADGVVIFDRATRDEARTFWESADLPPEVQVIVVTADLPLGVPDLPPEAHPFCVSEAPGKDRMDIPTADPQRAPLGEMSIYEIARWRFLVQARAAANIDLHDLLQPMPNGQSAFDAAVAAPGQSIALVGQHCYPWRVRKGGVPHYGDHICVQFDKPRFRRRWCVGLADLPETSILRCQRISNTPPVEGAPFWRCMAIRHPVTQPGLIVPKSSLIEHEPLIDLADEAFAFTPVRAPSVALKQKIGAKNNHTSIVTTMKNEGPFILEWLAYHRAIGVKDFLVYTNDCTDGTDTMFDLLQSKGIVQHRDNPFRKMELKPQHAALQAAEKEPVIQEADWVICMDVDEFLNIKTGDGTLDDLYAAVGDANLISCTWRLFGSSDLEVFSADPIIAQHDRCAEELTPKPHQAWGFKTLFRNIGLFKKLGVHRPKGLQPQLWEDIRWVNGSGQPLPKNEFRNAWRSTQRTVGYDLVALNHYAVRNPESFLVKRDRGRVNHVDRDQGLAYWFRMNNNAVEDRSIQRHIPKMQAELARLMEDPEIAAQHHACVAAHRAKIDELKTDPAQAAFYAALNTPRMQKLSRMHRHFGANVFLSGPDCVPDDVVWGEHAPDYLFTVKRGETQH